MNTASRDQDHLKILSILFYLYAGLTALFACIPIIHILVGAAFLISPPPMEDGGPPPELFGGIFLAVGLFVFTLGWAKAVVMFLVGRRLSGRRSRTFCLVGAGIACFFMPVGTLLGVFTILTLSRDSVREVFEAREPLAHI